ncbi:MAG: aldo/keto reductase [Longimicrobiales bacterium]
MSALGFGAATLGEEYGAIDPVEARHAVDAAIDHGVNLFDVAPYYGRTLAEERLGRFLQGKRHKVVLATKVGRYDRDAPDGFDFSAARVIRSVEESLRRLGTDVVDLLLAHDIEFAPSRVVMEETLPAMRALQRKGEVRFIGVTGYPLDVLRAVVVEGDVDVVLSYCHYNLLSTRLERELAPVVRERGVGLINASPLHMGVLTAAGPPPWHPAPGTVLGAAREAAAWCAANGVDIADVALRFALANAPVASTLVGMRTRAEVRASVRALDGAPDARALAAVEALLRPAQDLDWPSGLAGTDGRPGVPTQPMAGP